MNNSEIIKKGFVIGTVQTYDYLVIVYEDHSYVVIEPRVFTDQSIEDYIPVTDYTWAQKTIERLIKEKFGEI